MEPSGSVNRYRAVLYVLILAILAVGLVASLLVRQAAQDTSRSSRALVREAMGQTRALDAFRTRLLEHERLAYEAYGAVEPDRLAGRQQSVRREISERWPRLSGWGLSRERVARLAEHWSIIRAQSRRLFANLRSPETDWDAARAQLAAMTEHREAMALHLEALQQQLEDRAMAADADNRDNLAFMSRLVTLYAVVIFLIALAVGWVLWRIRSIARENQALAEFPRRNPDSVLTLDGSGRVTYSNPGADRLAGALIGPGAHGGDLLDEATRTAVLERREGSREVERGGRILRIEWGWLADLQKYHLYARDITERRRAENRLRRMAYEDAPTGLPNRQWLLEVLDARHRPGVLLVGLDRFGVKVAQGGYQAAYAMLAEVGEALRHAVMERFGAETVVARIDGALFGVVPGDGAALDRADMDSLLAALPREVRTGYALFHTDYRLGVRSFRDGDERAAPADLLRDANTALVSSKRHRISRIVRHDIALRESEDHKARMEAGLREALQRNRGLRLFIQPQVRLSDWTMTGGEFLLRWEDPELGSVPPSQFIPAAEQSGLIVDLGKWVLDQAVAWLAEWNQGAVVPGLYGAVNVAAPELHDPAWAEGVLERLRRHGVAGSALEVEVTERVLAGPEGGATVANLQHLRQAGVRVAVDDFGTGYSSLAYIHRLPIDSVKIDKQFVDPLPAPEGTTPLASVILEMAAGMGLETVAEGIETAEQGEALDAMGCTYGQGFLYARPVPAETFPDCIRKWNARKA
ncbi:putative bifunctional diguanylate cyclase/phosphodiesterase [Thiohalorhabdus sp. Cl-TMA]|uniref:Bifunctional diguanylate cyclase/phosphodiesterase n=1 Tax=Thiohalorhabdus methylotrophus TaxID=3242694 RepID=A0ABV4TYX9_9GAMM